MIMKLFCFHQNKQYVLLKVTTVFSVMVKIEFPPWHYVFVLASVFLPIQKCSHLYWAHSVAGVVENNWGIMFGDHSS